MIHVTKQTPRGSKMERTMKQKNFRAFKGTLLGTLCCLLLGAYNAYSQEVESASSITNQVVDMRVKVLGGNVRIVRRWNGEDWEWNPRWKSPVIENELLLKRGSSRYVYQRTSDGKMVFVDKNNNEIVADPWPIYGDNAHDKVDTFVWSDDKGNSITYKRKISVESVNSPNSAIRVSVNQDYFRAEEYSDKNGVKVTFDYDEHNRISAIRDHHGEVVLEYHWRADTSGENGSLESISDYKGRSVEYEYQGSRLASVTDVRGEVWKYEYEGRHLARKVSPEGRVVEREVDPSDSSQKVSYPNGKIVEHKKEIMEDEPLTYSEKVVNDSKVVEEWRNRIGDLVKRDINGDTVYKASYLYHGAASAENVFGYFKRFDENASQKYCSMINGVPHRHWVVVGKRSFTLEYRGCGFSHTYAVHGGHRSNTNIDSFISEYRLAESRDSEDPIPRKEPKDMSPAPSIKSKKVVDEAGNETEYEYDRKGNPTKVVYPDGSTQEWKWHDDYSLPVMNKNEEGSITKYEYDANGNLITLIRAYGTNAEQVTRYTYDDYGNMLSMTREPSPAGSAEPEVTQWEYDGYGNVIRRIGAFDGVTEWGDYDALGNAGYRIDARANDLGEDYRWINVYDAGGNLLEARNPYGEGPTFEYNGAGHLVAMSDASDRTTIMTVNEKGQPNTITDASGNESTIEYNRNYRPSVIVDASGHTRKIRYDERGRISQKVNGEGSETAYIYQDNNVSAVAYPTFQESYNYDSRDRKTELVWEGDDKTRLRQNRYDRSGNLIEKIDANGNAEQSEYDALGRLISVTDAEGGESQYRYNHFNQLTKLRDPEGRVTRFKYDAKGRLMRELKGEESPTRVKSYDYDTNDNPIRSTNAEGETITYRYDRANRLTQSRVFADESENDPVKTVNYEYNKNGQVASYQQLKGADGSETANHPNVLNISKEYTYTKRQEIKSVTFDFGSFSKSYSYTYYPNGQRKTYTNPEGVTYTYYYNANNTLAAVHIPDQGQLSLTDYHWLRPQTLMLPGGTKVSMSYNSFMELKERVLTDPASNDKARAVYEYDLESNIEAIQTGEGTYDFDYDRLYRLTGADYPEESAANDETFDYDGVGNRVSRNTESQTEESVYNDRNQLIRKGDTEFTYHATGHTATRTDNGGTTEYRYSHDERLVEVVRNGQAQGKYAYDPEGHRIRKTVNGVDTYFLYNEEGLAAEYDASGELIREYHFKPGRPWMTEPLFQRTADGSVYYYQNDHLGTPKRMVDRSGRVVWHARYSAFGQVDILIDQVSNPLRFPGQYHDRESGLYHNYFRDYDPMLGRYIQRDPIGLWGGINAYGYAQQNSLIYFDPYGLYTLVDAQRSLRNKGVIPENHNGRAASSYSKEQVFDEWLALEKSDQSWLDELPECPESLDDCYDQDDWEDVESANVYHPGGVYEMRSKGTPGGHSSQCIYDGDGNLMTDTGASSEYPESPGTADYAECPRPPFCPDHIRHDVRPYEYAQDLDRVEDYYEVRPVK